MISEAFFSEAGGLRTLEAELAPEIGAKRLRAPKHYSKGTAGVTTSRRRGGFPR